ncbi:class I SAM-dependent methyltransferase [Scytonema millei]|uniref:Class I SAM-dependent methyltransferase n=1 Tax=Scytonema millei VB511283 TaxID=1245923 RepID=A0A9X5E306_9CYAN|nr:methyltransferase domain-containing protein [Scytonema millei]NHC34286.1 class I SAM-dependent methyltransferase [Scytonema millei VB511283]
MVVSHLNQENYLKKLYNNRFSYKEKKAKNALWKVLIENFLQAYVGRDSVVLDIGGGYCEFINHVQAKEKYLIDLNPDSQVFANSDVGVAHINLLDSKERDLFTKRVDRIFISNFFEHLNNKEELIEILLFCWDRLKPGGSLLILQPNFKYSFKEYYDFIDHELPLTHLSLKEILETVGFEINVLIPRFLPYSTKGKLTSPQLLRLYLKLRILWRFLGGQMFVKAVKPPKVNELPAIGR